MDKVGSKVLLSLLALTFAMNNKVVAEPIDQIEPTSCAKDGNRSLIDSIIDIIQDPSFSLPSIAMTLSRSCQKEFGDLNDIKSMQCSLTVVQLFEILDINVDLARTFDHKFHDLLNQRETQKYLADLDSMLEHFEPPKNLWIWTLEHPIIHGDKEKALEIMAVLFQDTQSGSVDKVKSGEQLPENQKLLAQVEERLRIENIPPGLEVYPEGIDESKKSIYHFYVPAYLANQLKKRGVNSDFSFTVPYLLNRFYEVSTYNLRLNRDSGKVWLLAWDALKTNNDFPSEKMILEKLSLIDSYHGFAGSLFGLKVSGNQNIVIDKFNSYQSHLLLTGRKALQEKIASFGD